MMLTRACNQRCAFCYAGRKREAAHKSFEDICRQLATARGQCFGDEVGFSGGEPSLHPRFFDVLEEARSIGFRGFSLFTTGRCFGDPAFLRRCIRQGIRWAMVSLHGDTRDLHDSLVGAEGFETALEGIRSALTAGVPVTVNTVVTTENLGRIPAIYERVRSEFPTARSYRVTYPAALGGARNRPRLLPSYDGVAAVLNPLLDRRSPVPLTTELMPFCALARYRGVAVEYAYRGRPDFVFDGVISWYRRAGGRACLVCPMRTLCTGLQEEVVALHGIPRRYGRLGRRRR